MIFKSGLLWDNLDDAYESVDLLVINKIGCAIIPFKNLPQEEITDWMKNANIKKGYVIQIEEKFYDKGMSLLEEHFNAEN